MQKQDDNKTGFVIEPPGPDSTEEEKQIYIDLSEKYKNLPENHFGVYNNNTNQMIDLGTLDEAAGSVLFENDQSQDLDRGVSHQAKFSSLYNMFNSEPDINQGLNLKSELPVGYGYRFKYQEALPEFKSVKNNPVSRISETYWKLWASYVNYDHVLRQQIHSNYGMGNVWTEKIYDTRGMNRGGWGVRDLIVRSPEAMYNVVDRAGKLVYFVQSFIDTNRTFGSNFTISHHKFKDFTKGLKERYNDFDASKDIIKIPRHKMIYWNYNAYYDDTVYGFGSGIPLVSYARSKIGIQQRILRMIDNAASSLLVFKYGNSDYMVSGNAATRIFGKVKSQKQLKMVLLPWYFDVEEKELGKSVGNFAPYLDYYANQQSNGIGIPPFATGRGGSAEGAELQLELLVRQLMYIQKIVASNHRTQLFPEVILGDPTKSKVIATQTVKEVEKALQAKEKTIAALYPHIRPVAFKDIPELSWNIMERVSDRRLRHEVYSSKGLLSEEEMRDELNYPGRVADKQQGFTLRLEMAKLEMQERIEMAKIASQEKIAKDNAKAAAATKSVVSPPKKS